MRVLVVTVVHHPLDARIHRRQIGALLASGAHVTYAAPWSAVGIEPPKEIKSLDLPRSSGRRRLAAVRAARHVIRAAGASHDVVLLHDLELVTAVRGFDASPVVLDVHEDTGAALTDRPWLPEPLLPVARLMVQRAEHWAQANLHLLLAEAAYADRFERTHPVVPNVPLVPSSVPEPGTERVVHVGRISRGRGWTELCSVGALLRTHGVQLELYGPADSDVEEEVRRAADRGDITWHGFVPNEQALARIEGALAGLCLLHDLPNYRHSLPTKAVEYLAAGVPALVTPLPLARDLVERSGGGMVVPFVSSQEVAGVVLQLRADADLRSGMGSRGHAHALEHLNWDVEGPRFVQLLRGWSTSRKQADQTS